MKTAIFYLTQNTEVRRTYLKTSLYFLFKHFNAKYQHPVIILHEGDFDSKAQEDIIFSVRESCRSLVSFVTLDPEDFKIPSHIDERKMRNCIAQKCTPYWRSEKYRMMCRWWLVHFPKYASGYDYVMRMDDDSIIEEPLNYDLFEWFEKGNLIYASNMLHSDCGICCYGMKDFFEARFPDPHKKELLKSMFNKQEIAMTAVQMHPFRCLLSITQKPDQYPQFDKSLTVWSPLMYYNNFFITRVSFWEQPEVRASIDAIDQNGSIFYFRWGDAPLQTLLVMLHADDQTRIKRAVFKYSKRMQREAFAGDDGEYHMYMPATYDKSSCITER